MDAPDLRFVRLYPRFEGCIVGKFKNAVHIKVLDNGFEETAHDNTYGSLDIIGIMRVLVDNGFDGYLRPDHGRMIWGETGKPGYGLFDRALGASYLNGVWEALEKERRK